MKLLKINMHKVIFFFCAFTNVHIYNFFLVFAIASLSFWYENWLQGKSCFRIMYLYSVCLKKRKEKRVRAVKSRRCSPGTIIKTSCLLSLFFFLAGLVYFHPGRFSHIEDDSPPFPHCSVSAIFNCGESLWAVRENTPTFSVTHQKPTFVYITHWDITLVKTESLIDSVQNNGPLRESLFKSHT